MSVPVSLVEQEHPRKRQRTIEPHPYQRSSSRSTQAMPNAATAVGPSSSGFLPLASIVHGSSSRSVSAEHPPHAESESETRQRIARPDTDGADGNGDAHNLGGEAMKGNSSGNKGKAPETAAMSCLLQTPCDGQPTDSDALTSDERTCDVDRDRDRGGLDRFRQSASGAGAKVALLMNIDDSGLVRAAQTTAELVRDADYYIEGADCAIRVEDTLFRVHRYLLGRDDSAFQHMFSMPVRGVPSENVEGLSDSNPIVLHGESAERFRTLLSVLYALPPELQTYNTADANMDRLLSICEVTNKYHFSSIEAWARDAVFKVVTGRHGVRREEWDLDTCPSTAMRRLLEVAVLCDDRSLRALVERQWVLRILVRDLRPVHALEIAAQTGSKELEGHAFYVQLLEMGSDFDPGVIEDGEKYSRARLRLTGATMDPNVHTSLGTPAVLTREQKQRLLSGHWSLTRLWDKLRTAPPTFEQSEGCVYHQRGCLSTWTHVWQEVARSQATEVPAASDVLRRLDLMGTQLASHAVLLDALSPLCRRAALLSVKSTIAELKNNLVDHFTDLTDGPDT